MKPALFLPKKKNNTTWTDAHSTFQISVSALLPEEEGKKKTNVIWVHTFTDTELKVLEMEESERDSGTGTCG